MPEIRKYRVNIEVDVDVDEFLNECDESEINQIITWLIDSEYILNIQKIENSNSSICDIEYMSMINKLNDPLIGSRLSLEDLEKIKRITNKL
jgi:hypothetical protein